MIYQYKIENGFILRGFIENMQAFYQKLDLYITTSKHEGFPMSVLEAMANGLPIIAANTGGMKEIVNDGLHGYLVDDRNPKSFAEKCLKLYRDKDLSVKMGAASKNEITEKFSLYTMAEKYHNLYINIVYV